MSVTYQRIPPLLMDGAVTFTWGVIKAGVSGVDGQSHTYTVTIQGIDSTGIASIFTKSSNIKYTMLANQSKVPLIHDGTKFYIFLNELPEEYICPQ